LATCQAQSCGKKLGDKQAPKRDLLKLQDYSMAYAKLHAQVKTTLSIKYLQKKHTNHVKKASMNRD